MPVKSNTDSFIEKANLKHLDKYDYTYSDYRGNDQKVIILCKEHGEFLQTPHMHLYGNGCPKCGRILTGLKKRKPKKINIKVPKIKTEKIKTDFRKKREESFIKRSIILHDNKYIYDKVFYIGNKSKVIINCKIHGDFLQNPADHLKGCGCKECGSQKNHAYNSTLGERNKEEWLKKRCCIYLIQIKGQSDNFYKIGISTQKEKRFSVLKRKFSRLEIIDLFETNLYTAVKLENEILSLLKNNYNYVPNILFDGHTECIDSSLIEIKDIFDFFKNKENRSDLVGKILDYEYGK